MEVHSHRGGDKVVGQVTVVNKLRVFRKFDSHE